MAKIRGRFRWHILLKAPTRRELNRILARCRVEYKPPTVVRMSIDIDPVDMM
jgi:primosomal protein N' (replication factor Y)